MQQPTNENDLFISMWLCAWFYLHECTWVWVCSLTQVSLAVTAELWTNKLSVNWLEFAGNWNKALLFLLLLFPPRSLNENRDKRQQSLRRILTDEHKGQASHRGDAPVKESKEEKTNWAATMPSDLSAAGCRINIYEIASLTIWVLWVHKV